LSSLFIGLGVEFARRWPRVCVCLIGPADVLRPVSPGGGVYSLPSDGGFDGVGTVAARFTRAHLIGMECV
jgi:hypothetical protein